jgi:hypothetical protein
VAINCPNGKGAITAAAPTLNWQAAWSQGAWVYLDDSSAGEEGYLRCWDGSGARSVAIFAITVTAGFAQTRPSILIWSGSGSATYGSTTDIGRYTWAHIVWTYDPAVGTYGTFYLYINGVYNSTYTATAKPNSGGASVCQVGADRLKGYLSDAFLLQRVMTAGEIAATYALKRLPRWCMVSAVEYWPLVGPGTANCANGEFGLASQASGGHDLAVVSTPAWIPDKYPLQGWTQGPFGGQTYAPAAAPPAGHPYYYRQLLAPAG